LEYDWGHVVVEVVLSFCASPDLPDCIDAGSGRMALPCHAQHRDSILRDFRARHRTPPLAAGTSGTLAEIPARNGTLSQAYCNLATTLKN
jgi:hypothetical protein